MDDKLCIDTNASKNLRLHVNYEHTLVKPGGRGVKTKVFGKVLYDKKHPYLVRIVDQDKYETADF